MHAALGTVWILTLKTSRSLTRHIAIMDGNGVAGPKRAIGPYGGHAAQCMALSL